MPSRERCGSSSTRRTQLDKTGKAPEGSPALGALDRYTVDLEVFNSVVLRGTIQRQPWIPSSILGRTLQEGLPRL